MTHIEMIFVSLEISLTRSDNDPVLRQGHASVSHLAHFYCRCFQLEDRLQIQQGTFATSTRVRRMCLVLRTLRGGFMDHSNRYIKECWPLPHKCTDFISNWIRLCLGVTVSLFSVTLSLPLCELSLETVRLNLRACNVIHIGTLAYLVNAQQAVEFD